MARRLRCSGAPAVADGDEHKCGDGGDILCDWTAAVVAVLSDAREADGSDAKMQRPRRKLLSLDDFSAFLRRLWMQPSPRGTKVIYSVAREGQPMNTVTEIVRTLSGDIACCAVRPRSGSGKFESTDLPEDARKFIGEWYQVSTDNYESFLKEVVGLNWATRKIALRIKPKATWYIEDGKLCCKVEMIGAKTLIERYGAEPIEFDEEDDNVKGVTWHMKVYWDPKAPGVLCTEKISPKQNGGRPITIRRWVDATGLNVSQEWAPGKVFSQKCVRH